MFIENCGKHADAGHQLRFLDSPLRSRLRTWEHQPHVQRHGVTVVCVITENPAKDPDFNRRDEERRCCAITYCDTNTGSIILNLMYIVRKRRLGIISQIDALSRASGSIYTQTVVWFWRHVRRHRRWLSEAAMERRLHNGQPTLLYSQSAQAAIQCFFSALDGWRQGPHTQPGPQAPI